MKLIMENWNKFLNEEEEILEEGPLSTALAGLGLTFGAPGGPATQDAPKPEPTHQVTPQQDVEIDQVTQNADGTYTVTVQINTETNIPMPVRIDSAKAQAGAAILNHVVASSTAKGNLSAVGYKLSSDNTQLTYTAKVL